jgi:hypothetical protein
MGKEKPTVLTLNDCVVTRRIPMTEHGCDLLRTIRDYQVDAYNKKTGKDVIIPFPTAIHMALAELAALKQLPIKTNKGK